MVSSIECDGILRPLEVRRRDHINHADLSEFTLPLTRSEVSGASPKDEEAVPDLREAFPLGVVFHGRLFCVFLGCNGSVESMQDGALFEGVLGGAPMIGSWLLQHPVEETGASRSSLGVLAICRGDKVVVRPTCFPLRPFFSF